MASPVDICNMALSHLGARAQIASISPPDATPEAGYCARFYPIARKEALESSAWTWCKRRAVLSGVANPSAVFSYAYAVPADCLTALRVLRASQLTGSLSELVVSLSDIALFNEAGTAEFEIEAGVLLTNEPDAVLLYARDIVDTTRFSAGFVTFLSYLLAAYLAGPIIKGKPGADTAGALRRVAAQVRGEAATQNANSSSEQLTHIPQHLRYR